jgi:hypothetical protein
MKALLKRRLAYEETQPSKRIKSNDFDSITSSRSSLSDGSTQQVVVMNEENVMNIVERYTNQQTRSGLDVLPSDLCAHVIKFFDCYHEPINHYDEVGTAAVIEEYLNQLCNNASTINNNNNNAIISSTTTNNSINNQQDKNSITTISSINDDSKDTNKRKVQEEEEADGDVLFNEANTSELLSTSSILLTWEEKELHVIEHFRRTLNYDFGFSSYTKQRVKEERMQNDFNTKFRMVMDPTHPESIQSWIQLFTPEKSGYIHRCTLIEFYQSQLNDKALSMYISWNDLEMQIKDMLGIFDLDNIPLSRIRKCKLAGNVFKMFCIPEYLDSFNGCSGFRGFNYHQWIEEQFNYLS